MKYLGGAQSRKVCANEMLRNLQIFMIYHDLESFGLMCRFSGLRFHLPSQAADVLKTL